MKKYLYYILPVLFLSAILLPIQVRAAGRSGLKLDENGTITVVLPQAAREGISSLGFSLSVEPAGEAAAEFQFNGNMAEILEYRYDKSTGKLNVYVAGTEALFAEGTDSLTVGEVVVRDGSGRETAAEVSFVEGSLQYVHGAELETVTDMDLPGTVQIGPSSGTTPATTPPATQAPVATQPPVVTQAPAVTQTPVTTQAPNEEEESDGSQSEPAVSQIPAVSSTQQPPVRTQGTISRPQSTKIPAGSQSAGGSLTGSTGSSQTAESSPGPSGGSLPTSTPEKEEDGFIFSRSPDRESTDPETGSKGINVILTIAVIVIIIVIVVEIAAFVVIKKKPKK